MLTIKFENEKSIIARFETARKEAGGAVERALVDAAALIERHAKGRFRPPGKGRNPATGPETLRTQSGQLRRSILTGRGGRGFETVMVVGPRAVYGRIHEFGGNAGRRRASRIPARPYMQPALDQNIGRIREIWERTAKSLLWLEGAKA